VKDIVLFDVTPLSLGIETQGGVMTVLVPRNATIPKHRSEVFSTTMDDQTSVEIHVLQGERAMAADNRTLAKFRLEGIPPAPRGMARVEVAFDIDANGILSVSALDLATEEERTITVSASTGLTTEEVESMRADAELHAEEDRRRRAETEARNLCGARVYEVEKLLEESRHELAEGDILMVERALEQCRCAMADGGADRIRSASQALEIATRQVAQSLRSPKAVTGTGTGLHGKT